jgi:hypothetical protein
MMVDHFNSRTSQNKAKKLMKQLQINSTRVRKWMATQEALEYVREQISIIASQCPKEYGTDTYRADALAQVVRGEQWALETLKVHGAELFSYQNLYQRLESAFVFSSSYLHNSGIAENVTYTTPQARSFRNTQSVPRISSYKQDFYGTPRGRSGSVGPKSIGQRAWYNCGATDHLLRNCSSKHTLKSGILRHLQNHPANEVLYTLENELDEALRIDSDQSVYDELSRLMDATTDEPYIAHGASNDAGEIDEIDYCTAEKLDKSF